MARASRRLLGALLAAPLLVASGCKAGGGGGGGGGGDGAPVAVTGVDLNKHELSIVAGGSERLVATVLPANATNKTVSWSIDDPTNISVLQDGTVVSHSTLVATAIVTVTTQDGDFATSCLVTVEARPGVYKYVAAESSGLKIVDVRWPNDPHLEATLKTRNTAMSVFVSGNYAYVAESGAGLEIVDVTDPSAPVTVGACATQGWQYATAVWVDGDYAYIADDDMGLTVIDVTDRTNPVLAGSLDTVAAVDVTVSNGRAYVADTGGGLAIVNVADPHHPVLLGTYGGRVVRVAVVGDRAFLVDRDFGLVIVDVTNPASPALVGSYKPPGLVHDVFVSGDHAYVANDANGLAVVDVSDPTDPTLVGTLDTEGTAYGITVTGDYAYVADAGGGLVVVDVSDPHHPSLAGVYNLTTDPQGIAWAGDGYVYVADNLNGLKVLGWLDVHRPGLVGSLALPGRASDVEYVAHRAYVAGGVAGLHVVNAVVPGTPDLIETVGLSGASVGHVSVEGEKAYLSTGLNGLYIRDLTDPALDRDIRGFDAWDLAVTLTGSHVFVVSDGARLFGSPHLVVVHTGADPTHTDYEFEESNFGHTNGVTRYGNFLYVAARDEIFALNVVDPDAPFVVGNQALATGISASHLVADEQHLYVAGLSAGLVILNRETGEEVGSAATGGLLDVAVHGDNTAVACGPNGLVIVDVSTPSAPKVLFSEGRFMSVF